MGMEKKKLAIACCAAVLLLAVITYGHMLVPSPEREPAMVLMDDEYGFEKESGCKFKYVSKKRLEVVMTWDGYSSSSKNFTIPSEVVHHDISYKVVGFQAYSFNCDTLFIPATLVHIDEREIRWSNCDINYVSVDPQNKVFRSVDGSLYKGDRLLYDRNAPKEN
jgi:hypothetical protein